MESAWKKLGAVLPLVCGLGAMGPAAAQAAWPHDPINGNVALCTVDFDQIGPAIVSDGAGGAIVAWQDLRTEFEYDIYVQRVNAGGAPVWQPGGVPVCT